MRNKKATFYLWVSSCYFILYGCQSASNLLHTTFVHTPISQTKQEKVLQKCDFQQASLFAKENKSPFIRDVELGLLSFYQKDLSRSKRYFQDAIDIYRKNENKPLVAFSDYLVFDYNGEGYDKVFLHNYNALNYLLEADLENARVETKNSDFIQQKERRKFYEKIKAFQESSPKDARCQSILNRYEKLFAHVNPAHNPYQNPFAYYLSALLYEEAGLYDEALIDIKNALQFYPDSKLLKKRLECYKQGSDAKVSRMEIFVDIGKSPVKREDRIAVNISKDKSQKLYFPSFVLYISDITKLVVVDEINKVVAESSLISDINAIKINAFKRQLPAMVEKIFHETLKEVAGDVLSQTTSFAPFYKMISVIYSHNNALTWASLPQRIDVLSFVPVEGRRYVLEARGEDGHVFDSVELSVNCQKKLKNCYRHFLIREKQFCRK